MIADAKINEKIAMLSCFIYQFRK